MAAEASAAPGGEGILAIFPVLVLPGRTPALWSELSHPLGPFLACRLGDCLQIFPTDLTLALPRLLQDLKDYGRLGSNAITFADIDRNNAGTGQASLLSAVAVLIICSILEFPTLAEAEDAMKRLAGVDINGIPVEVRLAPVSTLPH